MPKTTELAICLLLVLTATVSFAENKNSDVYKAPNLEPTVEETLILEYMNRFRADPVKEADLLTTPEAQISMRWFKVDWSMFKKELKSLKPVPPVVFNLKLLDAARKHSWYMIHNELTHVEKEGKKGFTGKSFKNRVKAAGYKGGAKSENCFRNAKDPFSSHLGFVVDFGPGGPGGMQKGRGHRKNMMNGSVREVGPGAVPFEGTLGKKKPLKNKKGRRNRPQPKIKFLSVTHNFGNSRTPRFIGGVIYDDKNGNNFYDISEGIGGVVITASDGSTVKSWESGAYTLPLKSNAAVTIQMEYSGKKKSHSVKGGKENVKVDWLINEK